MLMAEASSVSWDASFALQRMLWDGGLASARPRQAHARHGCHGDRELLRIDRQCLAGKRGLRV